MVSAHEVDVAIVGAGHNGLVAAAYLARAGLSVTAGAYYTGPRAINQLNSAFIPGYTLLDAGASYSTLLGGHTLLFRLNGENITRRRYWASTGGLLLSEGPPGSVKFSVAWKY